MTKIDSGDEPREGRDSADIVPPYVCNERETRQLKYALEGHHRVMDALSTLFSEASERCSAPGGDERLGKLARILSLAATYHRDLTRWMVELGFRPEEPTDG